MANKYTILEDLERLRQAGTITEEEFQREKQKIMSADEKLIPRDALGMEENTYLMLMHLSQFAGYMVPLAGFIVPIVMWAVNKDKNENVDRHGKNILNFMLSWIIYGVVSAILLIILIGIPLLMALIIMQIVFIIMAAVKANNGEFWKYPLSIPFFNVN